MSKKKAKKMSLGKALKAARGSMRQGDLAEAIGEVQATISRWESGPPEPPLSAIQAIEKATGKPQGFILRLVGAVGDVPDVPVAIASDDRLDDEGKRLLMLAYRGAVSQAEEARQKTASRRKQAAD